MFSQRYKPIKITSVSKNMRNFKRHPKSLRKKTLKVRTTIDRTPRIKDPLNKWLKEQNGETMINSIMLSQFKRNFLNLNDYIRSLVTIAPTIQSVEKSDAICFLANLCHGTIPLNETQQNVEIIEFVSPIEHTRVVKAPMATCPISDPHAHYSLIKKMLTCSSHSEIKTAIMSNELAENRDINPTNKENFIADFTSDFTGEKSIAKCSNNCYKEIVTLNGNASVNKIFSVERFDADDGIYILSNFTFKLPLLIRETMRLVVDSGHKDTTVWKIMAEGHYIFSVPVTITIPIGTTINISEPYTFEILHTSGIIILGDQRKNAYITTSKDIKINHSNPKHIHLPENTTFTVAKKYIDDGRFQIYTRVHVSSMMNEEEQQIVKFFSRDGGNTILIYPYPIGVVVNENNGLIAYEKETNLLSCPFFIDYVKQIIETSVITNVHEIIRRSRALMYPYLHESVIATCASIIASYLQNCWRCITYDFSCQAYQLIQKNGVFVSIENFAISAKNLALLSRYARGITKRKRKGIKTNKKSQNKLKRKIH